MSRCEIIVDETVIIKDVNTGTDTTYSCVIIAMRTLWSEMHHDTSNPRITTIIEYLQASDSGLRASSRSFAIE